jgi:hypothetical protein
MPVFVAEKSQYRNRQCQERVAFSHHAPALAKPKFRHWHHGRVNWFAAAVSFLKCRVGEYEAVRLYTRAMLPGCLASAKLFFEDRQSLED